MTIKYVIGDLLKVDNEFDVIVHGCNCFSTMGAGIAKAIANKYPLAELTDMKDPRSPIDKLGGISHCKVNDKLTVINAYTQYGYKRGQHINVDYTAVKNAFRIIAKDFHGKRIGMPLIGAGLAGGDWEIIEMIIKNTFNFDITIVKFINDVNDSNKIQTSSTLQPQQSNLLNDLLNDFKNNSNSF